MTVHGENIPSAIQHLAIHGGPKVRATPWPPRRLLGDEEKQAAIRLFDSAIRSGNAFGYNGPEEEAYCREFAEFLGGGHADAVNSGTTAVYVALRALDLEPFTEVIVPPITDPGGVMPVPLMNCIPVPADSAPGSYNAGPDQIAARLTEQTRAILVAHISGLPCDMDPIMEIARSRGIPVVEDCAQAHGAMYKGRRVGTLGDIAAFSTMFSKHHTTGAQGGVVFTKNQDLYWKTRRAADRGKPFGLPAPSSNVVASLNFNGNELQAAIGRAQLKKLPQIVENRRRFAGAVAEGCRALKTIRVAEGLPGCNGSFWFAFFRFDPNGLRVDKAAFVKALQAEGLPFESGYLHTPLHALWYKERAVFGRSGYPWRSPLYKGDPDRQYEIPNALAADACHFLMAMHEGCGPQEVSDTLAALKKVESAFLRETPQKKRTNSAARRRRSPAGAIQ